MREGQSEQLTSEFAKKTAKEDSEEDSKEDNERRMMEDDYALAGKRSTA